MCGLMFSSRHPPAPPSFINLKKSSLADHLKRTPPPRVPSTLGCVSPFRHLLLLSETELVNRFLNAKTAPEAIPVWRALRWKGLDTTAFIRTHQDSYPPPPPLPVDCSHIFLGMFSVFFVSCAFLVLLLVAACCRKSDLDPTQKSSPLHPRPKPLGKLCALPAPPRFPGVPISKFGCLPLPPSIHRIPEPSDFVQYFSPSKRQLLDALVLSVDSRGRVKVQHGELVEKVDLRQLILPRPCCVKVEEELWKKHQLVLFPIRGDGNCLFRCFAVMLEHDARVHPKYRALACRYVVFLDCW